MNNTHKQCYVCGDRIQIGTTCDSCRDRQMNRPKLAPRSYKIEQHFNENSYYVEYDLNTKKWAIRFGTDHFLSGKGRLVAYYPDLVFDTPEKALKQWTEWYKNED